MTFDQRESSIESGRPIYLYEFILGTITWRYTSADARLLVDGQWFEAVPISDDGPSQSGEPESDVLSVTAPVSIGPAQVFMGSPPGRAILLTIKAKHQDDSEVIVCYSGEVTQVNFSSPGIVVIQCITLSATMQRNGLRLGWQRLCPYALYDARTCKVNKASWLHTTSITVQAGINVVVASVDPTMNYAGGIIEWTSAAKGGVERRMIEAYSGTTLAIFGPTDGLVPGLAVNIYPGCARTMAACAGFDNSLNYGGCAFMPGKSPFDGTPVF